jgi:hypothetical protein
VMAGDGSSSGAAGGLIHEEETRSLLPVIGPSWGLLLGAVIFWRCYRKWSLAWQVGESRRAARRREAEMYAKRGALQYHLRDVAQADLAPGEDPCVSDLPCPAVQLAQGYNGTPGDITAALLLHGRRLGRLPGNTTSRYREQ